MKKNYTAPLMVEVNVATESMLATSLKLDSDKTVDTSNGGQLAGGFQIIKAAAVCKRDHRK